MTRPGQAVLTAAGWATATRQGWHAHNEDRSATNGRLFAIADGLGGLERGDEAAVAALDALVSAGPKTGTELGRAAEAANNAVRVHGLRTNTDIGTTLTAALVTAEGMWCVSVGDTRAYLCAGGASTQLTRDDNLAAHRGLPRHHPDHAALARQLLAFLGDKPTLDADVTRVCVPAAGGRLGLTSDGVHDVLDPAEIGRILAQGDAGTAANELCEQANPRSHDDATAVVVDLEWGDQP